MREWCVKAEPIQIDTAPTLPATAIPSQSSQRLMSPQLRLGLTDVETVAVTYCEPCHFLLIHRAISESSKALCSRWLALQMRAINGNVAMEKLDQNQLLDEVAGLGHAKRRVITDAAELSKGDEVFFISRGEALIREDDVLSLGLDTTQTFTVGDSMYLAAVLSKRPREWEFSILEPLEVVAIDGGTIRAAVMKSGFLVAEVIRNSVTRVFDIRKRENATFEDRFLQHYRRIALRSLYTAGDSIYRIGEEAKGLYFISEGAVYLTTERHTRFAELRETDFFGESSLLSSGRHRKNVYAKSDCSVMLLDAAAVRAEVQRESPLVRLVLLNILNVLELMNQLRFKHLNAKKSGRPR